MEAYGRLSRVDNQFREIRSSAGWRDPFGQGPYSLFQCRHLFRRGMYAKHREAFRTSSHFFWQYMVQAFRHRPVEPANLSPVKLGTVAQGKSSLSPTQAPLISIPVNIGTMRPPGPRHIFVTSPTAAPKKRVTVNFGGWMP